MAFAPHQNKNNEENQDDSGSTLVFRSAYVEDNAFYPPHIVIDGSTATQQHERSYRDWMNYLPIFSLSDREVFALKANGNLPIGGIRNDSETIPQRILEHSTPQAKPVPASVITLSEKSTHKPKEHITRSSHVAPESEVHSSDQDNKRNSRSSRIWAWLMGGLLGLIIGFVIGDMISPESGIIGVQQPVQKEYENTTSENTVANDNVATLDISNPGVPVDDIGEAEFDNTQESLDAKSDNNEAELKEMASENSNTIITEQDDTPSSSETVKKSAAYSAAVIAGAFAKPENVEKMKQRLVQMGYTPYTQDRGRLTLVGVSAADEDIETIHQELRNKLTPEAWVLRLK